MNPLPFFPPPARAFSQTGRESLSSDRPTTSRSGHNGNGNPNPHKHTSSINFASLRLTSSLHGNGNRSRPDSGTTSPSRASASSASTRKSSVSSNRPSTATATPIPLSSTAPHSPATELAGPDEAIASTSYASSSAMTATSSTTSSNSSSSGNANANGNTPEAAPSSPRTASPRMASSWTSSTGNNAGSRSSSGTTTTSSRKHSRSNTSSLAVPSGRTGMNLPKGLFFDYVRPEEVATCHALEQRAYDPEDQATRDRMRYRQKNAPHLFLGAFVPTAPPKVAGPLSVGHFSTPRKLIAFVNATASSNLSARSLAVHSVSNPDEGVEAWLVCLHSIVVDEALRRKGVGLRLLEEFMTRLRRIEDGRGDSRKGTLEQPKGYEAVACLCHQESLRFFRKAGFQLQGISHVRCGSGGWIEMRRSIKGNHATGSGSSAGSGSAKIAAIDTSPLVADAPWHFSASPTVVENTGAPLAAFPTGTGRHEVGGAADALVASPDESPTSSMLLPRRTTHEDDGCGGGGDGDDDINTPKDEKTEPSTRSSSTTAAAAAASPSGLGGMGGFSQASLMAALAASSKGYAPGTNPSLPFSSVLGQTLAGKTFVEDAFVALEARLVDRRKGRDGDDVEGDGTNLAEIWCPREECGCKLVRKGVAMWELAESGPLSDPRLSVESMPAHASPLPPTPQPPPAPASHIRALKEREREHLKNKKDGETYSTRSTLPGAPPSHETSTPIRPFWSLLNPMSFENVAFSRDVKWTPPLPHDRDDEGGNGSGIKTPPDEGGNASSGSGSGNTATKDKVRKPVRRPTFFSKKDKDTTPNSSSSLQISHPHRLPEHHHNSSSSSSSSVPGSPGLGNSAHGEELTIKYILCGNCETGPLGYVIIPPKMSDGRLGERVGQELNGGGSGTGTPGGIQDIQIYLVAAERVRYRFVK